MLSPTSTASSQPPQPTPSNSKVTRGHSCILCQQRKVKCDGQKPCSTCIKGRVECISKAPQTPRRRKVAAQISKEDLLTRLRRCEELLRSHGVRADEGEAQTVMISPRTETHTSDGDARTSESGTDNGKLIIDRGHSRYIENDLWTELGDELQDSRDVCESSSEDDDYSATMPSTHHTNAEGLLFGRPHPKSLTSFHPLPVQIFMLWQTYLDNVNPLVKISHPPTLQQTILDASSNLDKISAGTEALMFAIYLSAVTSLRNEECESIIGESRIVLLERFRNAAQLALTNAELLKTSELVVLQAFTLFLLSIRAYSDPHSLWLLTGLAVRIGQRMGLHRESASRHLSIFEGEMRRRLWWQVLILDFRSAQLSGTTIEAEHNYSDTRRPLNVNDSDLSPSMTELPAESSGITDMLFCAIRYDIGVVMRQLKTLDGVWRRSNPTLAMHERDQAIDDLEDRLERTYLRYCDPTIPLHLLSSALARCAVCQMRLLAHHPRQYPDKGASLPQAEKDMLFGLSLKLIEYDNLGQTTTSIRGFVWHTNVYLQFDAFIYLLSELRDRVEGEAVERAWQQVALVFENHSNLITDTRNALNFAIGNLAVKAWEKHISATGYGQGVYQIPTPAFITVLRSRRRGNAVQAKDVTSQVRMMDFVEKSIPMGAVPEQLESEDSSGGMAEFDPAFLPSYVSMDESPMDWEYWQTLLNGGEFPMLNSHGQEMVLQS